MNPSSQAYTEPTEAFLFSGLTWIPHYSLRNLYVAPGGRCMDYSALKAVNAVNVVMDLWPRRWSREK